MRNSFRHGFAVTEGVTRSKYKKILNIAEIAALRIFDYAMDYTTIRAWESRKPQVSGGVRGRDPVVFLPE